VPFGITLGINASMVLLELLFVVDWLRSGGARRLIRGTIGIIVAAFILYLATGFPAATPRVAFGAGWSPELVLGVMFLAVVAGIAGHYIFHRHGAFSWGSLARPLVASPIVLLPLIGSLQGAALETIQVVSFVILAYQNGFFWREVLKDARKEH
jgi:hypothetical protein